VWFLCARTGAMHLMKPIPSSTLSRRLSFGAAAAVLLLASACSTIAPPTEPMAADELQAAAPGTGEDTTPAGAAPRRPGKRPLARRVSLPAAPPAQAEPAAIARPAGPQAPDGGIDERASV